MAEVVHVEMERGQWSEFCNKNLKIQLEFAINFNFPWLGENINHPTLNNDLNLLTLYFPTLFNWNFEVSFNLMILLSIY